MINDDNINKNSIPWDDPSWLDEEEKNQIKVTDINEQITETTEFVENISVDSKGETKSFHGDKFNERDHKIQTQMFNASDRHQDQLNVSDTQQINRRQNQNYFKKNYHNKESFPKNGKSDIMSKKFTDNCDRNLKRQMEHDKYRKIDPDDTEVCSIDQMLNNIRIGAKNNNNVEHELENKSLTEHENNREVINNTEICQESSLKKNSDEIHIEESNRSNNNTPKRQSIQVYNVNAVKGKWSNIVTEKDSKVINDKSKCNPETDKSCNNRGSDRSTVNQKDKLINDNLKMEPRDTFTGGTRKPEYTNRLDKKDLNERYFEKKVPLKFPIKFNEIDDFDKLINRKDGAKLIANDSQKFREEKDANDTQRPMNNNYKEKNESWKKFGNEKISEKGSYNQYDADKDDLKSFESKTYYNKNYNEASDNYWKFDEPKDQTNNISGKSTQSHNNQLNKDCESKRCERGEKDNQNFKREYNGFNNNRVPNMRNIRSGGNFHGGQNVNAKNITRSFCPTDNSREYDKDNYGKKNTRDVIDRNDRKQKEEEIVSKDNLTNENCKRNEDGRYNIRHEKDQKNYTKGNYREFEPRNDYRRNEIDRKQEFRNQSDVRNNRFRRENISLKDSHDCNDNGGTPTYPYNNNIKNSVNRFNNLRNNNIDDRRENRYPIHEKDRFMRSKPDYNLKNSERTIEPDNFVSRNLDEKEILNNDYKRFMGRKGNEESQINNPKCNKDQQYERNSVTKPMQDRGKYNSASNREQIEGDNEYKISTGRRKFNNDEDSSIRNRPMNNQKFEHDSVKPYNRNGERNQQPSNYNNNNTQNITKERSNRFHSEINPSKNS